MSIFTAEGICNQYISVEINCPQHHTLLRVSAEIITSKWPTTSTSSLTATSCLAAMCQYVPKIDRCEVADSLLQWQAAYDDLAVHVFNSKSASRA